MLGDRPRFGVDSFRQGFTNHYQPPPNLSDSNSSKMRERLQTIRSFLVTTIHPFERKAFGVGELIKNFEASFGYPPVFDASRRRYDAVMLLAKRFKRLPTGIKRPSEGFVLAINDYELCKASYTYERRAKAMG